MNSPVYKWPEADVVDRAVRRWAESIGATQAAVQQIGYIGSYARGDWGVGSDLDLVIILQRAVRPFWERALDFDLRGLPVPADLLIYTESEWEQMKSKGGRFYRTVQEEAVWVFER